MEYRTEGDFEKNKMFCKKDSSICVVIVLAVSHAPEYPVRETGGKQENEAFRSLNIWENC